MQLCGRCRAAEHPQGNLAFIDSPEGVLCIRCYSAFYSSVAESPTAGSSDYAVILCPDCRGSHHAPYGNRCEACAGYGSVRIQMNSLPVYPEDTKQELLTEQ